MRFTNRPRGALNRASRPSRGHYTVRQAELAWSSGCKSRRGTAAEATLNRSGKSDYMKKSVIAVVLSFGLFAGGSVLTAKPSDATTNSAECSKEADVKGLHSTQRKRFLSECLKAGRDATLHRP